MAFLTLNPTFKRWAIFKHPSGMPKHCQKDAKTETLVALNVSFPVLQRGGSPGSGEDVPAPRASVFMNWPCGAVKVGLIFLTLYRSVS